MSFPEPFRLEELRREHPRVAFESGHPVVDSWLAKHALQNQGKHLSVTRVLVGERGDIAGYYTLATGQVEFADLPAEFSKKLPRRALPVAVVAWLGVHQRYRRQGLGTRLLARALADCHAAGRTFPFIAVILDCVDDDAKRFYQRWDFREMPGRPMRLFLSAQALEALMCPR